MFKIKNFTLTIFGDNSISSSGGVGPFLTNPQLLGRGAGGAVYSFDEIDTTKNNDRHHRVVAVKVSWIRSAISVQNECKILQYLQSQQA